MSISHDQQSEVLQSLLIFYIQVEVHQNILKLKCQPLACTLYKSFFFLKKRDLDLVFLYHLLHYFLRKIFLTLYSIDWPSFIDWLPFIEILGNIVLKLLIIRDIKNFVINLVFLSNRFLKWPKSQEKINILRTNSNTK